MGGPPVVPSNHHSATAGTITTARRPFKTAFRGTRAQHYPRPLDQSPIEAPSRQVAMAMMPSRCCRMTASQLPRVRGQPLSAPLLRNSYLGAANADIGIQAPNSLRPGSPATCLSAPLSAPFRRPAGRKRVRDRPHLKPKPLMVALTGKRRRVRSRNPCASARISVPHTQEQ